MMNLKVFRRQLSLPSTLWSVCALWAASGCHCVGLAQALKFTDASKDSGIDFVHSTGGSGQGYLVEGVAAGVATFDYDNDGWMDIYFLNGARLKENPAASDEAAGDQGNAPTNRLYRNNGDFTFTDVTQEAGVGDTGYGLGVVTGDFDGDGHTDIYVNNFGPNVLYRNRGDRTFEDVTEAAGVSAGDQVGAGAAFLDIEGDGDLDLYVANYVDFSYETHVPIEIKGMVHTAGPQYYNPLPDILYRNDGDGTFTDVSAESGIGSVAGPSMGLICADFENDGDTDVYVCNDGKPNFFFVNDGSGKFEEVAVLSGVAYSFRGDSDASMGVDIGDYDADGFLDLFSTNYQSEMPNLYHSLGGDFFEDASNRARIPSTLYPHVNWGTAFVDVDNDGDLDLFIACGHFDRVEQVDDRTSMKIRNYLLLNEGGKYRDATEEAGEGLALVESSRAAALEDFDNDGDLDIVIVNSDAAPNLLRNESANENHWIQLKLSQAGANSAAIGARVTLSYNGQKQIREVVAGRGYQSHFGSILHFGLGASEGVAEVTIRWPGGDLQSMEVPIDELTAIERDGKAVK